MIRKKESDRSRVTVWGFTLTELLAVAAIVSSIPAGAYVQAKNRAVQVKCLGNLNQAGQLIQMYNLDNGNWPKAAFYPKDTIKGKDNIMVMVDRPGRPGRDSVWICPAMPLKLKKKTLTFVYNDSIGGRVSVAKPSKTWVLIEITCVSKTAPHPHPQGFNILYADGHVKVTPELPADITKAQKAMIKDIREQWLDEIEQAEAQEQLAAADILTMP